MPAFVLWTKEKHGTGLLNTLDLEAGAYEFVFDTRLIPDFILGEIFKQAGNSVVIEHKRITLDDVVFEYRDEKRDFIQAMTLKARVEKAESEGLPSEAGIITPRLILAGLGIIGGVVAIAFLKEVRKVVEPKNVIPIALILLLFFSIVSAITSVFKK